MKILIICSGNTCRSPMAEYLLRQKVDEAGLTEIIVASAGTGAWDGSPSSEGSYLVGLERGIDLTEHRARLVTREMLEEADLTLCMSRHHVARVKALVPGADVHLIGSFADPDSAEEIPDPFGGDLEGYRRTAERLDALLTIIVDRLRSAGGGSGSG